MKLSVVLSVLFVFTFFGCKSKDTAPPPRQRVSLQDLAIGVRDTARSYMLSDKTGGFLLGEIGGMGAPVSWSVDGVEVMNGINIRVGGSILETVDNTTVYPHQVEAVYRGGITRTISVLDGISIAMSGIHAFVVQIQAQTTQDMSFDISVPVSHGIRLYAGEQGTGSPDAVSVKGVNTATVLVLFGDSAGTIARELYPRIQDLLHSRVARMEDLLESSYIKTSDEKLNKALYWAKLSLDALIIETRDTFAVAGVPWDGSINGRDNAQSIAGIGLGTSDFKKTAAIIRSLSLRQDTVRSSSTYGRIAGIVKKGAATYAGADIGPWFVREMYEYVTYSNDTSLLRAMYPVVRRSIEGTLKYHVDSLNLLVHGDGETWMGPLEGNPARPNGRLGGPAPRGNRAVEVQHLWYFEQLIGSFVASHAGDSVSSRRWAALAEKTSESFNTLFVDTTTSLLYDHLGPDGVGSREIRPNPVLCIEIVGTQLVQQTMIKKIVNALVYSHGVGTLSATDTRFNEEGMYNGPVWTWLTGQIVYALTRYDRQDLSYVLTQQLTQQILEHDMVGVLPAMYAAARPAGSGPKAAGSRASLTGMAEYVRSAYQDYLGVRVDVPSNLLTLQPKLPDQLSFVDFTVYSGVHPIHCLYYRGETSRIVLRTTGLQKPMVVKFIWMMENGDAWQGTAHLSPDEPLTIVMGEDDALAYAGEKQVQIQSRRKLKGFSQRSQFAGIGFAKVPDL